ncbi:hypothetical protein FA09DRAFT_10019 [Tilletiopsis washingtonensis]|uniref:Uncharacterized protein n=1 Tax=Tilletiopsis washingtonensis TaxID=58919 RepID=A0A316ZJP8_9BASI|nr:hypothetical protein FA09DRAFT_10019 [Tilletiopsis washingtonensis]PWO01315.1 hypothetical protein FA09DRAFT_10019 [Tilletiopsis washingtonensis]
MSAPRRASRQSLTIRSPPSPTRQPLPPPPRILSPTFPGIPNRSQSGSIFSCFPLLFRSAPPSPSSRLPTRHRRSTRSFLTPPLPAPERKALRLLSQWRIVRSTSPTPPPSPRPQPRRSSHTPPRAIR